LLENRIRLTAVNNQRDVIRKKKKDLKEQTDFCREENMNKFTRTT